MNVFVIQGLTGMGKTISLVVPPDGVLKQDKYEGLPLKEVFHLNLDGGLKILPFKVYTRFPEWKKEFQINEKESWFEKNTATIKLEQVAAAMKKILSERKEIKHIIIDTLSLGMFNSRMLREDEKGYEKWVELAINVYNKLLRYIGDNEKGLIKDVGRDDFTIWILNHVSETLDREGITYYRSRTEGNLLKDKLEELTSYIFFATKYNDQYVFETQSENSTAKTPPLLFKDKIPNSMKLIYDTVVNNK